MTCRLLWVRAWLSRHLHRRSRRLHAAGAALALGALTTLGLVVRLRVLHSAAVLNADEAIEGLMALHISRGQHFPAFFYGQPYFGALEAYLGALWFRLAGFEPLHIQLFPVLFSTLLVPLMYRLGALLLNRYTGLVAAALEAVPPAPLARLFVSAAGGYALALSLHMLALVLALECLRRSSARGRRQSPLVPAVGFALVSGLTIWVWQPYLAVFPLLLVVVVAASPQLRTPVAAAGLLYVCVLGALPLVLFNIREPLATLSALQKNTVFTGETVRPGGPGHALQLLWVALGGGYESFGGSNLLLALLAALGPPALLLAATGDDIFARRPGLEALSPTRVGAILLAAGLAGAGVAHATARHLLPPALLCWLAGAAMLVRLSRHALLPAGVTAVLVWLNASGYRPGTLAFQDFVAGLAEVRETIAVLDAHGLRAGYGDYWSAYPLTYLTGERIVVAPSLPTLWGGPFDRYPAYGEQVRRAERPFLLVEQRCISLPQLQERLASSGQRVELVPSGRWLLAIPHSADAAAVIHAYAAAPLPC
jgi:hypothetical protein